MLLNPNSLGSLWGGDLGLSQWHRLGTHPRGGPLGRGPGVSSGRSPEPAGGTEQTGKGRAEGRPQGGGTDNGMHSNGRGVPQYRKRGILGCKKAESTPGQPGGQQQFFKRNFLEKNLRRMKNGYLMGTS